MQQKEHADFELSLRQRRLDAHRQYISATSCRCLPAVTANEERKLSNGHSFRVGSPSCTIQDHCIAGRFRKTSGALCMHQAHS